MAELKTYTCDICKVHGAKRFIFPHVDRDARSIAEQTARELEIDAPVDLCPEHTERLLKALLKRCPTLAERRAAWLEVIGPGPGRGVREG